MARRGLAWGVGHTATLLALGGTAMLLGSLLPDRLAATLEFAVGLMLVLLVGARRYERRARPERAGRLRERGAGSLGDVLRRPRRTPGLSSGWWFEVTPTGSKADR